MTLRTNDTGRCDTEKMPAGHKHKRVMELIQRYLTLPHEAINSEIYVF